MKKYIVIAGLAIAFVFSSLSMTWVFAEETTKETTEEINNEVEVDITNEEEEVLNLGLQEAIDFALENNKDIEIKRLELLKEEIVYRDEIRAVRDGEDNAEDIPLRNRNPFSPEYGQPIPNATFQKAFIKNGGARRSVELGRDVATWNLEMKENEVKYNVEKAYFDLLQIERELEIAVENLELAQKQYDYGKLRLDVGMISQQQLLGLEYSLSQAQSGYESAKMYYGLQRMSFRNTLGMDFTREFELTDELEVKEYEEIVLEDSIEMALESNGSAKIAKENAELLQLNLDATSARYPENTYNYRELAAELAKAEQGYIQAKNGVEMQVRSAVVNLTTAEKQIATFEKAVEQASEGVRISELSFELGQNTATEVAQANLNLMNAKKNLAQQIHAYNMALLDYKYSIGIGKGF